jgi:hypothetical protein
MWFFGSWRSTASSALKCCSLTWFSFPLQRMWLLWHPCMLPDPVPAASGCALLDPQLSTLANMHRVLTAAGLSPADLMLHCAFLWCWMFEEYARGDWPQGRFVLLADMSGLKLAQAVGEGQVRKEGAVQLLSA